MSDVRRDFLPISIYLYINLVVVVVFMYSCVSFVCSVKWKLPISIYLYIDLVKWKRIKLDRWMSHWFGGCWWTAFKNSVSCILKKNQKNLEYNNWTQLSEIKQEMDYEIYLWYRADLMFNTISFQTESKCGVHWIYYKRL